MTTTIRDGAVEASIDALGAQLMSLRLDGGEYLWQGDARWWSRRSPVLFPIVGSLRDDRATSAAGEVRLGRHGLARNFEHAVVSSSETSVTYELVSSDETRADFPFDFRLNMAYTVEGGCVEQSFSVTNTGDTDLPFVVGGHPAFNVPAPGGEGEDFSDYTLVFERPWTYASPTIDVETGILDFSNRFTLLDDTDTLRLDHRLFDVDTLVFEDVPARTVRLVGPQGHGVVVSFAGFDYLGVWSAAGDAPFVAVEPWTGCATATDESDVFEEKRGMACLAPGETATHAFTMRPF